jgi:hypothetical protein
LLGILVCAPAAAASGCGTAGPEIATIGGGPYIGDSNASQDSSSVGGGAALCTASAEIR